MTDMAKVAAVATVTAICAVIVRRQVPEIGLVLALCGAAAVLLFCVEPLRGAVKLMDELAGLTGLSSAVVEPVMKVTGIAVLSRLSAELCRDAGEGALASAVETAGSAFSLLAALPLVSAVLQLMKQLM